MYKTFKKPIKKASPDIKLPEPRISMFVIFLLRVLMRGYLLFFYGISKTLLHEDIEFYKAIKRALEKKSRLIIAFRHPNGGEPQFLTWFFLFKLRWYAFRKGVRFPRWPHAMFVYGYEVVRWGGWVARFILSGIRGMPIYHSKMDSKGMTRIYNAIDEGRFPVAIAPEGQVSYSTDTIPRLEPGVIRIGFGAALHMEKKDPSCPIEVLPLSIHFRFGPWGKATVEILLRHTEKYCGFAKKERKNISFRQRIDKCREYILKVNEERYNIKNDDTLPFEERLDKVTNAALETGERILGLKSEGDFFTRLHKVRQICWDKIFLPDVFDFKGMPRLRRSIKDLEAGQAWYTSRHQELAEFCWYFKVPIPSDDKPLHNKIEYVQNLYDFASRTMGGGYSNRISIFPRKVIIKTAPVINLTERLPRYKEDRKTTISDTLADLEKAYIDDIIEMNRIEKG